MLVQAPGMGKNHFANTSPEHKSALAKLFSSSSSSSSSKNSKKANSLPAKVYQTKSQEQSCEQKEADAVEEVGGARAKRMPPVQIDPILFAQFNSWRESGHPIVHHAFVDRIQTEEVNPCMEFTNQELSSSILDSIAANQLELEPVHEDKPSVR